MTDSAPRGDEDVGLFQKDPSMFSHSVARGLPLCALVLMLSAHPVLAEDSADQSAIIVTASPIVEEAAARVQRTPGGVDVVSAQEFDDKLAVSLRDALSFSPGVYTQPRFGQEVRISIRGSGLSRGYHMRGLTLLQDGIPINAADDNGDFRNWTRRSSSIWRCIGAAMRCGWVDRRWVVRSMP
jgi:iron complex outermembrane recepter protein